MNSDILLDAIGEIDGAYVQEAEELAPVRRSKRWVVVLAAAAALLAALSITAYATDFFGIVNLVFTPAEKDYGAAISLQGYLDSPEAQAYKELMETGADIRQVAEKYGLTANTDAAVLTYDEIVENVGGRFQNDRHAEYNGYMYSDGTFSIDSEYSSESGNIVDYQLVRCVRGSLTDILLYIGDPTEYDNWNLNLQNYTLALALDETKGIIIADLKSCFVTLNVLEGTKDGVDKELLEELAKSIYWDVLADVKVPNLPEAPEPVAYGAGVELLPEYIMEGQSFDVNLAGWGDIKFITYRPTPEFDDVRFFLSYDGKVSDYEFHPFCNDDDMKAVVAVSFEDLTGDDIADVLVLIDYANPNTGRAWRDVRLFKALGGGEFDVDVERSSNIKTALSNITVQSVRDFLMGSAENVPDSGNPKSFEDVLAALSKESEWDISSSRYALFDLDGDGTEEMIVEMGTCEGDAVFRVYGMKDAYAEVMGETSASHSSLYVGDGKLLRLMGHMGVEQIDEIYMEGGQVKVREVSSRTLTPEEEYAIPGTNLLTAAWDDLSLLKSMSYNDILDWVQEKYKSAGSVVTYSLYDLCEDSTPELFIVIDNGNDEELLVYSMEWRGAVPLGSMDVWRVGLYDDGERLIMRQTYLAQGIEIISVISWENGRLFYRTESYRDGLTEKELEKDYPNGKSLEYYPISDRSALEE